MASYVMLFHYTHQGIEHVQTESRTRRRAEQIFSKHGAKIKDLDALLGDDSLFIVDAPNDETVAKLSLYVAEQGSVRVEILRVHRSRYFKPLQTDQSGTQAHCGRCSAKFPGVGLFVGCG